MLRHSKTSNPEDFEKQKSQINTIQWQFFSSSFHVTPKALEVRPGFDNFFFNNLLYIDNAVSKPEELINHFELFDKQNKAKGFHIFSHGRPGELFVNGSWLNWEEIVIWLNLITDLKYDQLKIYGCNFAKGEKEKQAVSYLEAALGVAVAASDDITGIDGDWDLEVGSSNTSMCVENYMFNLQDFDGDGVNDCDDLDDDNDGILDVNERNCGSSNAGSFSWSTLGMNDQDGISNGTVLALGLNIMTYT